MKTATASGGGSPASAACMILLCATVLSSECDPAGADDWPAWRGYHRDGVSAETGWRTTWPGDSLEVLWEASIGVGYSSVSVADGRLYTMGHVDGNDIVFCLDAGTGAEIWRHEYPSEKGSYPGPRMTPTVDGDLVFTLAREGELICFDAASGDVVWETNITEFGAEQTENRWGYACSPLVLGEMLILDVGRSLAFDKKDGSFIWASGADPAACSSPVAVKSNDATYVTSFNPFGLVLVNAATGKEFARYEWPDPHGGLKVATPIVSGDRIFISTAGNNEGQHTAGLFQVNADGLKPLVTNSVIGTHITSCVLWQGYLYGFDGMLGTRTGLLCLDFQTLEVKWSQDGLKVGSLIIVDGKLLVLCGDGELICAEASPEGFKPLARAKVLDGTCWTNPVLARGRIFCRNHEGRLVCLDVRPEQIEAAAAENPH